MPPGDSTASSPRYIARTSAQDMICRVLAVKIASTARSGHNALIDIQYGGRTQIARALEFHPRLEIGQVRQLSVGCQVRCVNCAAKCTACWPVPLPISNTCVRPAKAVRNTSSMGALFRSQASEKGSMAFGNVSALLRSLFKRVIFSYSDAPVCLG